MKLAYVTAAYPAYAAAFTAAQALTPGAPFTAQRAALERDAFGWAGAWGPALAPLGWEVLEVWLNLAPLQRAWAEEQGGPGPDATLDDIALAQLARFAPDLLWYDYHDAALLSRIRERCPSLRAVVGWVGSTFGATQHWRAFDLVLTCALESRDRLAQRGVRAAQIHHAFNERVTMEMPPRRPVLGATFVGQLAPDHPLHVDRERLLERLLADTDLAVFSPHAGVTEPSPAAVLARRALHGAANALRRAGIAEAVVRRVPLVGRAVAWPSAPRGRLPARLRRALRPGRFGLEMYRTLRDSKLTLNVQGGPAGRFTSNMRLFEATGVGTCLLTDEAQNLSELFEPGREVASFASPEECGERLRWLLEHDAEREAMALAGRAACLARHTFRHRAPQLDPLLRGCLR